MHVMLISGAFWPIILISCMQFKNPIKGPYQVLEVCISVKVHIFHSMEKIRKWIRKKVAYNNFFCSFLS